MIPYVVDGTFSLCTNGKKPSSIVVNSQTTSVNSLGQLYATENDRFKGNFTCVPMMAAGALAGALAAPALAMTGGGILLGLGALIGGNVIGKLATKIPSICSLLTTNSKWDKVHPKSIFEGQKALLTGAGLNCFLGGRVTIIDMAELIKARNMAILTDAVYDNPGENLERLEAIGFKEFNPINGSDFNSPPWVNPDTGFAARMYQGPNGENVLVFRGTNEGIDWLHNGKQGVGLYSEHYDEAIELVKGINKTSHSIDTVAGHSLGGGLASLAGAYTQAPTYTFNAAGVHHRTFGRYGLSPEHANHVRAYSGDDDILTTISDNRESILGGMSTVLKGIPLASTVVSALTLDGALPRNNGQRIELETDAPSPFSLSPAEGHAPKYIIESLNKIIKEQGGTVYAEN